MPEVLYLDPNTGSGTNQGFYMQFSEANGAAAITQAYLLFNSTLSGVNACWVFYNGVPGQLGLVGDNGIAVNYVMVGTNATVQNSQCILTANGSDVSMTGNYLSVFARLTFKPSFGGTKGIYLNANAGAMSSGWQQMGDWSVPTINVPPAPVNLSPASGAGAAQVFAAAFLDANGPAAITQAYLLVNSTFSGANGCWVFYGGAPNQLGLVGDSGAGVSYVTLGTSGTVQNSQCTLSGLSEVYFDNDTLYMNANLSFKPAFSGAKTVYLEANAGSLFSGWEVFGAWTIP